jgi:NADH:ubiquinone oxidoreductase subunit 4 (subunit M)
MLRLFQNVMQGPQIDDLPQRPDLSFAEIGALAPLVLAIVLFGVAPRALLTSPPGATVIQAEPLNTLGIHAPAEHAVLRLAARGEHR